jgi:hypothetical protein
MQTRRRCIGRILDGDRCSNYAIPPRAGLPTRRPAECHITVGQPDGYRAFDNSITTAWYDPGIGNGRKLISRGV